MLTAKHFWINFSAKYLSSTPHQTTKNPLIPRSESTKTRTIMANGTASSDKVISPAKLAHVVLRTSPDTFKEMVQFYKTFLGGQATYENDSMSFITYDDEHHRIAILAVPGLGRNDTKTCGLEVCRFPPSFTI
jgi:catechol-2,3-dioxygenase